MEGHIFSTDLAEKVVWFVGLKNTIFCAPAPKAGVYLKVYGTVEIQKGTIFDDSVDCAVPPEKCTVP